MRGSRSLHGVVQSHPVSGEVLPGQDCPHRVHPAPPFDGDTYDPALDGVRLGTLLADVRAVMSDGQWMTVTEVRDKIGRGTETSVSARIRDLRKRKFGGHTVESRRRGNHRDGLWEYRLTLRGTREPETH